ncbi:WD40-repeat-containing domain protein [Zychaea mexicana]|uniref:WD40-repeat-containing domain protein n=1 Tax=Zychaea mexicana TaxID=64656 RepID=UPI0022FDFFA6|nr:WD40-repeat-containing domain protein [Zychaea mexicana]KAI9499708.1 WD40-repeat-containing domain protein [Zychaea mexicana]
MRPRQSSNLTSSSMPVDDLYGNEGMAPGRSLGDPRLLFQQRATGAAATAGLAPQLIQRRRSGLDLTPTASSDGSVGGGIGFGGTTPATNSSGGGGGGASRMFGLTRQQSEGGGTATIFRRRDNNARRLQHRRPIPMHRSLARSQTDIRLPRENSIPLTRSRSRSPIRWARTSTVNGMPFDAAASYDDLSRENSASATSGAASRGGESASSGWRRLSSSLARIWGRSESDNNNNEQQQQQQQQQNIECFQDRLEGPSSSSSAHHHRHHSLVTAAIPASAVAAIPADGASQVVDEEEDTAEEAMIPTNDANDNADARPSAVDRADDEDPDPLLCPICRDLLNSVAVTVCGHTFCYPCISQYVAASPDCPICRSRLTQQQILPNYQFSDLVEMYREDKRRGSQSMIRSVQSEPKRNNAALLEAILKDLPYKEALALLQPAVARKKQEEVDRKVTETILLEEFLARLKEKHKCVISELETQIKVIDNDLVRAKSKRAVNYMNGVEEGLSSSSLLLGGTSEDATVIDTVEGDASGNSATTADNAADSLAVANSLHRAGHKRKIQELLGFGGDTALNDSVSQAKRQRLYERFESLHELYLKEACIASSSGSSSSSSNNSGSGTDHPFHYDLDKLSSLLYETTRFSSFRVLDTLFHNDSNTSSIISSIEFDRDDEFFAIAGVSREIKLFDASMIADAISVQDSMMDSDNINDPWPRGNRDTRGSGFIGHFQPSQLVHCPVKVIPVGQKISCLSWNTYVKSHIASSDYEGTVRVWDVNEGQAIRTFDEHEKRAWSVDMCSANPTYLASGGDDSTVKIWSTSMAHSVMTLPFNGNVCCAKFAPNVANYLAVGTADHSVICYDLRNTATPIQSFSGHRKAVSYVRWLDDNQLISASTDNTLRRWNNTNGECQLVYSGHKNEKNFVGLSVSKDWISCGSEDNSIYTYHKGCKTPIAKFRFPAAPMAFYDPQYTQEEDQLSSGFVSSTCWKRDTNTLLAANSKGIIKVLQMVP